MCERIQIRDPNGKRLKRLKTVVEKHTGEETKNMGPTELVDTVIVILQAKDKGSLSTV